MEKYEIMCKATGCVRRAFAEDEFKQFEGECKKLIKKKIDVNYLVRYSINDKEIETVEISDYFNDV